jgi:flagellar basal body rod protein FlgB
MSLEIVLKRTEDSHLVMPSTPTEESNVSTKTKREKQSINFMDVSKEKFHFSKNTKPLLGGHF